MTIDRVTNDLEQESEALPREVNIEDSLEDSTRRELLARVARVGATAVPVSLVLLDSAKANTIGSEGGGIGF